jgi:arylsulfatase A-like enzyme
MKRLPIVVLLGLSAWVMTPCKGAGPRRPNIVFILADDLGYGDVRCLNPQHGKIATPHLDRLAAQGMVFTDAHSGSSLCSPSRYGILTGRYAWRSRLQSGVLRPYDPPLIARDRLTVPGLLAKNGYHTACIGKWHLGWQWPREGKNVLFDRPITEGPTTRGFQYYFGTDVPNYPPYGFLENARLVAQPTAWCPADAKLVLGTPGPMVPGWQFDQILPQLTAKAVEYVGRQASDQQPFFLYLPLTSPHEPIAPSAQFRGKSRISPVADFIMETDWAVGQVMEALEKNGQAGNTLLIFTADNGHCPYTGLKPFIDVGHWVSQRFRGFKSDIWEGGHRIPFIARWPGQVKPGSTCDRLICLTDLMASCADLLGTKLPDNAGEDSVSILPPLRGSPTGPHHEAVVHHSGNGRFSLRQGKWKVELCPGSGGWSQPTDPQAIEQGLPSVQLYDMSRDDTERVNVEEKHPEVVERLVRLLEKYVAEGRSTPGVPQKNDVRVDVWKQPAKPSAAKLLSEG